MDILLSCIASAAAWIMALLFIRLDRAAIGFYTLIAAGLCAAANAVIRQTAYAGLPFIASTAVFLLLTLAISLQRKDAHGDATIAFLIAEGAFAIFCFTGRIFLALPLGEANLPAYLLPLIFAFTAFYLRDLAPKTDWRDYFSGPSHASLRMNVRKWHIYGILVTACLLCTGSMWLTEDAAFAPSCALAAALSMLLWLCLLAVVRMINYRQEGMGILIEQQYRSEMQSFMNVIRSQRHDYNFHVQTLARMLRTGDTSSCEKYVEELVKDSIAMNALLPVKDPAISSLINNFRTLAAREGIELHINIQDDLSRVVTNVYETNKVISNLLQNAIDETKVHADKSYGIGLTILKRGEYCVIRVSNAFHAEIAHGDYISDIYRHGYTTKPGHDGIGLSSVRTLLARYRGTIYTEVDNGVICFTAKIPMRYSPNQEDEMAREEAL